MGKSRELQKLYEEEGGVKLAREKGDKKSSLDTKVLEEGSIERAGASLEMGNDEKIKDEGWR